MCHLASLASVLLSVKSGHQTDFRLVSFLSLPGFLSRIPFGLSCQMSEIAVENAIE